MESEFENPFPLLIVTGKGGVGKTVLTAALGTESAHHGRSTLVVEVGGQSQLPTLLSESPELLESPDDDGIVMVTATLGWQSISPDRLLAGWLSGRSMGLIADRLERSGALSVIASSVPGIKDVLLLGHLRSLVDSGRWDRIIVDAPASGRARELLRAPRQVAEAATEGPIFDQATRAHALLTDGDTCAVLLVTIAEETPINETIETAFDIEDDPGIRLAGLVVNRLFPLEEPSASFDDHDLGPMLRTRYVANVEHLARLDAELPVPRLLTRENPHGILDHTHILELLDGAETVFTAEPKLVDAVPESDHTALRECLDNEVVVTVGTGGVGKTTIGAALAYQAASEGKSVALVTIDPAKRLADALGLDRLDDDLHEVEVQGDGRLRATMLDPGRTFERVVRAHADSPEHAERILGSPLAAQLTDSLSGMTEYMAVERLWELHTDPTIDLVVVDTPPSSDALAFLDAPTLLARLLDNRIYKLLVHGKKRSIVNRALGGLVGQLVATVGGTVMREAVDFFKSFEGVEDGFRERGDVMHDLLRSNDTGFVVVASPTGASLRNAERFVEQLAEAGVSPRLTIANRCAPAVRSAGRARAARDIIDHLRAKRIAERANIAAYAADTVLPMVLIDDLPEPVADLEGIKTLSSALGGTT